MERTQRIARINALLSRPQGASLSLLMSELEVSRATINRDLQVLRDGMNAPIVWDSFERVYRLEPNGNAGPTYMLPGLWLRPAQAYAVLTLNNMVQKIAPNVLGPFLLPMRGLLKEMLHDAEYKLRGLDRKIEIDMPAMPQIGDLDFENLVEALVNEQPARFVVKSAVDGREQSFLGTPVKLRITARGWRVDIHHRRSGKTLLVSVERIIKVIAADENEDHDIFPEADVADSSGEISK